MTDESPAARHVDALVRMCADFGHPVLSVVLFGSAATGGFSATSSDVDLILVMRDGLSSADRRRLMKEAVRLETLHGYRTPTRWLEGLIEKVSGNAGSSFLCTRADMLSGKVERVLSLHPAQALLVDRIVFATIVASAITVQGEDLLPLVPVPPIRRVDVFKALFNNSSLLFLSAAAFPFLPAATKYAMGALKHALHSCFFCYHGRTASLEEEIEFFRRRLGPDPALLQLPALRREYEPSFPFVLRCLPLLVRMHLKTAVESRLPRQLKVHFSADLA